MSGFLKIASNERSAENRTVTWAKKKKKIRTKEDWKEDSDEKIACTVHLRKNLFNTGKPSAINQKIVLNLKQHILDSLQD